MPATTSTKRIKPLCYNTFILCYISNHKRGQCRSRTNRHLGHAHVRAQRRGVDGTVNSGAISTHHSFCSFPIISPRKSNRDFTYTVLKYKICINIWTPFYKSVQYVNTFQTFLVHHGLKIYFLGSYIGERFMNSNSKYLYLVGKLHLESSNWLNISNADSPEEIGYGHLGVALWT